MAALLVAFSFFFVARLTVRGEIYPGVQVVGVPLGGLNGAEARSRLENQAAAFGQRQITLAYDGKTWTPTLAEIGVGLDIDGAVYRAMSYGRDDHVLSSLFRPLHLAGDVDVPLSARVDLATLDRALQSYAEEAGIAPQNATVSIVDGAPALIAEQDGVAFNGELAEQAILDRIAASDPAAVSLGSVDLLGSPQTASVRQADFAAVEPALIESLSAPMIFSGAGQQWSLSTEEMARFVELRSGSNGVAVSLNERSIRSLGEQLATAINQDPTDAALDEGDKVSRLVMPQPGRTVRVDDFVAQVQQAFASGEHNVAVPIDEIAPTADAEALLADLGVTDLLATGTSDFSGSDVGRATNVIVAAELVDNVLIPPHGEFTFNYSIGEINVTPGFVPAGASENGIAGTAVGGGVCQVTTTIFRAALKAGLPITEWWPHAYRNIYYEQGGWAPGFDASVQQPDDDPFNGSDLIFENPTDNWMLLRSSITDETKLTVELYGTPTGYQVEIEDPIYADVIGAEGMAPQESIDPSLADGTVELVQPARDGMTMTVNRYVYDADGNEVSTDSFVSVYEPQGASYRVSSDMAGTTASGQ